MTLATNINEMGTHAAKHETIVPEGSKEQTHGSLINKNQDLHYLYKQAPIGIILNILSALLVCWFIMPSVPDYLYVPWLAFIVITSFTHTILIKEFNKNKNTLHVNNQWAVYHTFMSGLSALTFSIGYLMFLPIVDSYVQTILLLVLATLAVSFLPILSIFLPAYIIYISTFIFPTVFWIYSLPPESGYPLAALLTVTYCMLIITASYYSRALLEAFGLASTINEQAKQLRMNLEERNTDNIKLKRDIHELGKYSDAALRQKEQAEVTLQSIGEGVIATDQYGKVTYINPVAEVYTGFMSKEINSRKITSVLTLVDETSHMELPNPVFSCLEKKAAIHGTEEILLIRRDGLEYGIEYSVTPIISEQKTIKGTVMIFRDITEKRKMERTLSWQDTHDPLTGLINRNEFNRRLVHLVANTEDRQSEHALCLIDLDRFRLINDSCGNEAGDALLKKVANRLRNLMRDADTLARIANDEFALIMYSCSLEKARLITEIFREEINKLKFDWEEKHYTISTSIGITTVSPSGTDDIAQVYRNVELACNKAKSSGGNGLQVFSPELTDHRKYTGHLKLLEELQHNLSHESFKIYTQSIRPLDDLNDTLMQEVLLRMKNENGEIISAETFIQTAESYHLLASIDKWVLKFIMEMITYGKPVFKDSHIINVNISRQSILNEQFIDYLDRLLKEYELAPSRICLEINERHFYSNVNSLQRFISLVKQIGCKIALDDFNYNPETINNVRKLNVDYVKLDARQFNEIGDVKGFNYSLLESINKINHMVGAQTIVKCLDNNDMLEQLFEIGTDYIQGYAYEPPKPVSNN